MKPHANVDLEPRVSCVLFVPFRTPLDDFFMFLKVVLQVFDLIQHMFLFLVVAILPDPNGDDQ